MVNKSAAVILAMIISMGSWQHASAAVLTFDSDDFVTDPQFSDVQTFQYTLDLDEPIIPGGVYDDPDLNSVAYRVNGTLAAGTPSGFPAFALVRTIAGDDFYLQGSSLQFKVSANADLSDGLQMSELEGDDPVFVFNGRELGQTPGRYHPSLFELNADGTGLLRNSNNMGGINPGSGVPVDVEIGDEYVTQLGFLPSLTIAETAVPEPSGALALTFAVLGWVTSRRRFRDAS